MNALHLSLDFWNKCIEAIRKAKERPDLAHQYLEIAVFYRMKHECFQAIYFAEVRP